MWWYIYEPWGTSSITNRIELDKNELDKIKSYTNLYYKQSKNTLISMKTILQELGKFLLKQILVEVN